jgi:hypothetical protein
LEAAGQDGCWAGRSQSLRLRRIGR